MARNCQNGKLFSKFKEKTYEMASTGFHRGPQSPKEETNILLVRLIQKMQNEKRFLVPKFRGPVYWGKQITRVRHKDSGRMGKNGKCEGIHGQ